MCNIHGCTLSITKMRMLRGAEKKKKIREHAHFFVESIFWVFFVLHVSKNFLHMRNDFQFLFDEKK